MTPPDPVAQLHHRVASSRVQTQQPFCDGKKVGVYQDAGSTCTKFVGFPPCTMSHSNYAASLPAAYSHCPVKSHMVYKDRPTQETAIGALLTMQTLHAETAFKLGRPFFNALQHVCKESGPPESSAECHRSQDYVPTIVVGGEIDLELASSFDPIL